jgi:pSer/pThr/pTyr-binding forkhead associated (FHA) protein
MSALNSLAQSPELARVALQAAVLVAALVSSWALGGLWYRRRRARQAAATAATCEARRQAAAAITTARQTTLGPGGAALQAVVWDGRRRRVIALAGRHWTIGSDLSCTIVVQGEGVAPLHARLSRLDEGLTLTDLESASGTLVGLLGRPLTPGVPASLAEGEVVQIGPAIRVLFERVAAAPAAA